MLFSSLAIGLLALVGPFATGLIFDTIVPNAERGLLMQLTSGLVVVALGSTLFEVARAITLARIESRLEWLLQAAVTDRLQELLPDVERLNIPEAGHPMFISHPEEFNRGVIDFIDRHDVDPRSSNVVAAS